MPPLCTAKLKTVYSMGIGLDYTSRILCSGPGFPAEIRTVVCSQTLRMSTFSDSLSPEAVEDCFLSKSDFLVPGLDIRTQASEPCKNDSLSILYVTYYSPIPMLQTGICFAVLRGRHKTHTLSL